MTHGSLNASTRWSRRGLPKSWQSYPVGCPGTHCPPGSLAARPRECAKLNPKLEQALADEGLARDRDQWPNIKGRDSLAALGPVRGHKQAGARPVLVLSHDVLNERSGTIIAVALSSQPQRAGFPLTLELDARGLPRKSWVKISQIGTLSVERIGARLAHAMPEILDQVVEPLK